MSPARYAPAIGSGISAPSSPVEHPRLVLERKLASLLGGNGHAGAATATELASPLREVENRHHRCRIGSALGARGCAAANHDADADQ